MSTKLPPEALECIAAHLLALEWLTDAVQDPEGHWRLADRQQLVHWAQRNGVALYRRMTPQELAEACQRAMENYRAIAGQLGNTGPDDLLF